jgi:hypothetical protein
VEQQVIAPAMTACDRGARGFQHDAPTPPFALSVETHETHRKSRRVRVVPSIQLFQDSLRAGAAVVVCAGVSVDATSRVVDDKTAAFRLTSMG